jgi:hypothetical protein
MIKNNLKNMCNINIKYKKLLIVQDYYVLMMIIYKILNHLYKNIKNIKQLND